MMNCHFISEHDVKHVHKIYENVVKYVKFTGQC